MKKILAFMLLVVLALSLCACSSSSTATQPKLAEVKGEVGTPDEFVLDATADQVEVNKYADDIVGLCEYLADKNCISEVNYDSKAKKLTVDEDVKDSLIVAKAELIGAEAGYKFTYTYDGGSVVVEVYKYKDTNNKWYKQAKAEGKITLSDEIENGTFDAILSDNGKYVMIYNDSVEGEARTERREAVIKVFNSFYN